MFRGMGKIGFRTRSNDPTAKKVLYAPRANTFNLNLQNTEQESKAWSYGDCGPAQTIDKVITDSKWSLKVGTDSFDKLDISYILDEQIQKSATATFPEMKASVVPTDATLENPDIAGGQEVVVTNVTDAVTMVAVAGAPGAGEFSVGTGVITFNTADVGKAIVYMYDKEYANAETIGLETTYKNWGDVCFTGVACGPRFPKPMQIYCPAIARTGNFDFTVQDQTKVELEFTPKIVSPYRLPVLIKF